MQNSQDYIKYLEKEIERLNSIIKFYEEIILMNPELEAKMRRRNKYYGKYDRRKRK